MRQKLKELLNLPLYSWQKQYIAATNIKGKSIPPIPTAVWKTIYHKAYARLPEFKLPTPQEINKSFHNIIFARSSSRDFRKPKISKKDLSTLLYYAFGIKQDEHRFYPSGGARYPLESYLLLNSGELASGLYHYYVKSHSLEQLVKGTHDVSSFVYPHMFDKVDKISAVIFVTSVWQRTQKKYHERGYHYAFIEAGHAVQNLLLAGTALSYEMCPIGGYFEEEVHNLLDIDGIHESIIYAVAIG